MAEPILTWGLLITAAFLGGGIVWLQALVMMISAVAGGYVVARVARQLPESTIRFVIIATGAVMTALFFLN
ncbi:hypothetical protein [Vreelandella utahensis]|uniref:hypothetical protein n=1 Tax=Vreelandella halophila TaxID=86177 RepID=UPI000986753A|nr:hypothetical protein [Halomonas utahensis]